MTELLGPALHRFADLIQATADWIFMPWVVIVVCVFLYWYTWNAEKKGVLR